MTKEEKIKFIVLAVEEIEGVKISPSIFKEYSNVQLDKEVEWYDYLLTK
jgi:hypothetical protein